MTIADVVKATRDAPEVQHVMAASQNHDWPRLRCILIFGDEDPTKLGYGRVQVWSVSNLQDFYNMDKECSRLVSDLALPRLMNEINVLREPEQAAERFRCMVTVSNPSWTPTGESENDNGEMLEEYLERTLHLGAKENGGSGP